jgi:predicted nucleotidyltransferase
MREPRDLADSYVRELRTATADRLQSATLFGSAARGEWIDGLSDVNVLILVDTIDTALLAQSAPASKRAVELGVTPLLMELDEWAAAADVFAIEFSDMQQSSVTLFGESPTAGAMVQPAKLRLQAERELRARLLNLHGGMLLGAGDRKRLGQLVLLSLPSFTTYLRAVLRLARRDVPISSGDVIAAGCDLVGADATPFLQVHAARVSGDGLDLELGDTLVDDFNTAAKRLVSYIDELGR